MNFSIEEKQNKLGEDFSKAIFENLDKYDDEFSRNLKMILSKALRTIAFTRDAHVRYLTVNAKDLANKKEYWDQFSQLASFSKEGLPLQVLSFFGFGSLGDATGFIKDLLNSTPIVTNVTHPISPQSLANGSHGLSNNVTVALNKIAHTLGNATQSSVNFTHGLSNNVTVALNKIAHVVNATHPSTATTTTSSSTTFFTNFVIYGVAGLVAAIVILRIASYLYLRWQENKYKIKQENYYKDEFKEDMAQSLFYFFIDLRALFWQHYGNNYSEDIITWSDEQVKSFISINILPPDDLQWAVQQEDNKKQ
jgi:hypothetical protein